MTMLDTGQEAKGATSVLSPQLLEGAGAATADLGPIWIIEEVAGHLRSRGKQGPTSRMRLYRFGGDVLSVQDELELRIDAKRADAAVALLLLAKAQRGVLVCSYRTVPAAQLIE